VETRVFPLYEYNQGQFSLYKTSKFVPVEEYLKIQGRFAHLKEDEIKEIQNFVNERWEFLLKKEGN
jgi:pyruvate ferredoxin oxidoreductase beta subunit